MSRREWWSPNRVSHATGAGILPRRSNRRQGSRSNLHKQQCQGFLCHLGREWVTTQPPRQRNRGTEVHGGREDLRLKAMQHLC
jgi:hypothetical protein